MQCYGCSFKHGMSGNGKTAHSSNMNYTGLFSIMLYFLLKKSLADSSACCNAFCVAPGTVKGNYVYF